jgi:hypothetical protein
MKKNTKIWLFSGIGFFLVILLIFFFGTQRERSYVTDNWHETYAPTDKGPYGTYVMKELLDTVGFFGEFIDLDHDLDKSLKDDEDLNDIYFFIGKENFLQEESVDKLMDFVENGNTAFIATKKMSDYLNDYFFLESNNIYKKIYDSTQTFRFNHENLRVEKYNFDRIYNNEKEKYDWHYFKEDNFDLWNEDEAFVLGTDSKNNANFIKISYGEGAIFMHSNPYVFTNVCMLKENGFEYAEAMLGHIPPGRVQWDRYNLYEHSKSSSSGDEGGEGNESRRSILEFIFKNKALTWAFVILMITVFLYVVFKGKRMQDIVKPIEPKDNTSLRYIETVSSLYLQEKKHGKLIRLKEKTFMNFIAEHYFMTTPQVDAKFIKQLAEKSQVEEKKITEIFNMFSHLREFETTLDEVLIELHRKIEYFYYKCK